MFHQVWKVERLPRLLIGMIGIAIGSASCGAGASPSQEQRIDPWPIIDEDPESATQPLSSVLDLDYNKGQSWVAFRQTLLSRLRHHQFKDIDDFAAELRRTDARFPGGVSKLFTVYDHTNEPSAGPDVTEQEWKAHLALFEDWITKYPESITARAGYADSWVRYAWRVRGGGYASSVSSTQVKLFNERLGKAQEIAEEAFLLAERCPHLYSVLLSVAQGQGWRRKEYDRVFEEAIAFAPHYRPFYFKKAFYLLPRWYGREGEWQHFAVETAGRLGGEDGAEIYYYIYKNIDDYYEEDELPGLIRPVWNRLKEGFAVTEARYRVTPDQLSIFGRMAYLADDKEAVHIVLEKLGSYWNQDLWGDIHSDPLRAWAASGRALTNNAQP